VIGGQGRGGRRFESEGVSVGIKVDHNYGDAMVLWMIC